MAPLTLPDSGTPADGTTEIERSAEPVPDVGLTCSQGCVDCAVHVTVPGKPD